MLRHPLWVLWGKEEATEDRSSSPGWRLQVPRGGAMRTAAGAFLVLMWLHCELGVLGEEGVYYIFVGSVSRIVAFPNCLALV